METALNALETHAVARTSPSKKTRGTEPADILEELLELSRNQQRILTDPASLLPPEYITYVLERAGPKGPKEDKRDRILEKLHRDIIDIEQLTRTLEKKHKDLGELTVAIRKLHGNFHEVLGRFGPRGRRPTTKRISEVEEDA